jgi:hypothetical protein
VVGKNDVEKYKLVAIIKILVNIIKSEQAMKTQRKTEAKDIHTKLTKHQMFGQEPDIEKFSHAIDAVLEYLEEVSGG